MDLIDRFRALKTLKAILITMYPKDFSERIGCDISSRNLRRIDLDTKGEGWDFYIDWALHLAWERYDLQLLDIAFRAGGNPNNMTNFGSKSYPDRHPLASAISIDDEESFEKFCKYGLRCDAELIGTTGYLIHYAVKKRREWAIPLIAKYGGDLNSKNSNGETALHMTLSSEFELKRSPRCADLLISLGADIECPSDHSKIKYTPVEHATIRGDKEVVSYILKHGVDINKLRSSLDDRTLLMIAALWGFDDICSLLLDFNADPRVSTQEGKTALWFAYQTLYFRICGADEDNKLLKSTISSSDQGKIRCQKLLERAMRKTYHA